MNGALGRATGTGKGPGAGSRFQNPRGRYYEGGGWGHEVGRGKRGRRPARLEGLALNCRFSSCVAASKRLNHSEPRFSYSCKEITTGGVSGDGRKLRTAWPAEEMAPVVTVSPWGPTGFPDDHRFASDTEG